MGFIYVCQVQPTSPKRYKAEILLFTLSEEQRHFQRNGTTSWGPRGAVLDTKVWFTHEVLTFPSPHSPWHPKVNGPPRWNFTGYLFCQVRSCEPETAREQQWQDKLCSGGRGFSGGKTSVYTGSYRGCCQGGQKQTHGVRTRSKRKN